MQFNTIPVKSFLNDCRYSLLNQVEGGEPSCLPRLRGSIIMNAIAEIANRIGIKTSGLRMNPIRSIAKVLTGSNGDSAGRFS